MPREKSIASGADKPTIDEIDEELFRIAREGARRLLQQALEAEIEEHLDRHTDLFTQEQHKAVVRNGYAPEPRILTGVGPVEVRRPRIDERKAVEQDRRHERFSSEIGRAHV